MRKLKRFYKLYKILENENNRIVIKDKNGIIISCYFIESILYWLSYHDKVEFEITINTDIKNNA